MSLFNLCNGFTTSSLFYQTILVSAKILTFSLFVSWHLNHASGCGGDGGGGGGGIAVILVVRLFHVFFASFFVLFHPFTFCL